MIQKSQDKILMGLKKATSHIDKIVQMVERGDSPSDIIQQILAVQGYLKSANTKVLQEHLAEYGSKKLPDEAIEEIIKVCGFSKK